MGHLSGEVSVDQVGGGTGIDNEECRFAAVDDDGHDDLVAPAVDAGPILHGWRLDAIEAVEIVGRIAAERVECRLGNGGRLRQWLEPNLVLYVVEGDEIAGEDVGADEAVTRIEGLADVAAAEGAEVFQSIDIAVFELDASNTNRCGGELIDGVGPLICAKAVVEKKAKKNRDNQEAGRIAAAELFILS